MANTIVNTATKVATNTATKTGKTQAKKAQSKPLQPVASGKLDVTAGGQAIPLKQTGGFNILGMLGRMFSSKKAA
jgi:hypothetical protein